LNLLPYAGVAVGYGLLLVGSHEYWSERIGGLILGALVLTGLVIGRQVTAVRENNRLLAERAARAIEARFRSLVQQSSDLITVIDAGGVIRYQSPSLVRLLGHSPSALVGTRFVDLLRSDDVQRAERFLGDAAAQPGASAPTEWHVGHRDGGWREMETIVTNLLDDPNVQGLVLNSRDVTEGRALERELTHQSLHDALTGLANRTLFADRVAHALARAARRRTPVAVLKLDLDNFKAINDSLGYPAGDRLLVTVAERLGTGLRLADTVARLGGDEFAVLLEDASSAEAATAVAERIAEALRPPITLSGREVTMSASIGIALSAALDDSADDMLRNADVAM